MSPVRHSSKRRLCGTIRRFITPQTANKMIRHAVGGDSYSLYSNFLSLHKENLHLANFTGSGDIER